MEEYSQTQQIAPHGNPFLRIAALLFFALLIALISSLTTYYFLNKQSQTQLESYQQMNMVQITTVPTQSQVTPTKAIDLKQQAYDEIFLLENPTKDPDRYVKINNAVDSFASGGVGSYSSGSSAVLWEKTAKIWKRLFLTQYAWSCKILLDNKVPPSLFSSSGPDSNCVFYKEEDCKGYEKECSKKDRTKDMFSYKDLYKDHFGS